MPVKKSRLIFENKHDSTNSTFYAMWKEAGKTAEELYGTGLLEVGDYVNYDAGTWADAERNSISTGYSSKYTATAGTPSNPGQFGGLSGSKNGTNGWRVWSINKNQEGYWKYDDKPQLPIINEFIVTGYNYTITLVSADGVETYRAYDNTTGNENNIIIGGRDWNQYVNEYATNASFFDYFTWRGGLTRLGVTDEDFEQNSKTYYGLEAKYINLFYVGYRCYLGQCEIYDTDETVYNHYYESNGLCCAGTRLGNYNPIKIRVNVNLSKDVRYTQVGTKTNSGYTYKVWDISF